MLPIGHPNWLVLQIKTGTLLQAAVRLKREIARSAANKIQTVTVEPPAAGAAPSSPSIGRSSSSTTIG
eukprot:9120850-Alexandrium_andersonii.AAC.1